MRAWRRGAGWLRRRQTALWWLHSAWALAFGIGAMWLGSRNFAFLRLAFLQVVFIWATSLVLPTLATHARLGPAARAWTTTAINYFNKNFYQQVLFFVLPVYWGSVTVGSRNVLFVGLVAVSAVLATLDVVYDRHLSVRRGASAVFFAFNLFVCVNVALPVLWSISNAAAVRLAALLALLGFVTLNTGRGDLRRRSVLLSVLVSAAALAAVVEWGRAFIPPAPLRLVRAEIGTQFDGRTLTVVDPRASLPPGWSGTLYAATAIKAPLGLKDRVRHQWTVDGRELRTTPYYTVTGGRAQGFRLWTVARVGDLPADARIEVDVQTEGGQLIGRASFSTKPRP